MKTKEDMLLIGPNLESVNAYLFIAIFQMIFTICDQADANLKSSGNNYNFVPRIHSVSIPYEMERM